MTPVITEEDPRHAAGQLALALAEQLRALAANEPPDCQPTWTNYTEIVQEVAQFLAGSPSLEPKGAWPTLTQGQRVAFGKLVRDKRGAAGFSRLNLARKAKLSDATIKFLETARHPPSRATLIRLIGVAELNLTWADVPGGHMPPAVASTEAPHLPTENQRQRSQLNCLITPTFDSLALVANLARFLNGAGGYVEQANAYLDHYSAAGYLAICRKALGAVNLRAAMPLAQAAKQILAATGPVDLQVLALGAGDGTLETRLARHLLDEHAPSIELCLLDISQPLLNCAYQHAAEALNSVAKACVWGMQCNFHELPLYTELYAGARHRRLFCLLGGTLANLDHEPRFLRQSLINCEAGDLLLLDVQTISASCEQPEDIKRRDKLFSGGVPSQYAEWLSGPIWRHCKDIDSVAFHWHLDTYCPVPGSYALHAKATVKSPQRGDRQFSLFRFTRYDPTKLAKCLSDIGWDEVNAIPFGGDHSLRLYCKRTDDRAEAALVST